MIKYFISSIWVTVIGLILAAGVGYYYTGTASGALSSFVIAAILGLLEVSISFDNAVVNATVLKDMTPQWQHRFITWGMLIAVFGMRMVFPLLIVGVVAHLNPWQALVMAATAPADYAQIMLSVHHEVASFGGTFLMLVALQFFFNHEKNIHWIQIIERPLARMGRLEAIEIGIVIAILFTLSHFVHPDEALPVIYSGLAGILTFLAVEAIGTFLQVPEAGIKDVHKASASMFIYLEVLDASFSFDGVIGAFAITNNLFIIAIGLGIGAMFVRSLTIMMVERNTLDSFKFLENGAFFAVGSLAIIMFVNTIYETPEIITGLIGAAFIGFSIISSRNLNKKEKSN